MNHESMNHESMNHESMNHESMNKESMNHESMNKESMNKESMNHESKNLNAMPYDIIRHILYYVCGDNKSLINLKLTSMFMNREITSFKVAKQMLLTKLGRYEDLFKCVNVDCYEDSYEVFTHLHNYGYRRYIHKWQEALNETTIVVNKKAYKIKNPYCCECLKKHILVGTRENVIENYDLDSQVNIVYT